MTKVSEWVTRHQNENRTHLPLEAEILLFNLRCELEDKRLECEVLKLRIAELEMKLDNTLWKEKAV